MPIQTAADPPKRQWPQSTLVSKMMEQMSKGFYNFYPGETWTPNVNLYETDASYLVCVDLAGVVKEEIDVQVIEQRLILKGTRAVPIKPKPSDKGQTPDENPCEEENNPRCRVHLMEIDHGPFSREVELPENIVQDRISATHRNGMLWIELPKKQ